MAAYAEVQAAYGYRIWRSATQQARVVLEGMVKTLLNEAGIDEVPNNLSRASFVGRNRHLGVPIRQLGDALRAGGNLASHFDDRGDVTEELAVEMLDWLDAFIEVFRGLA